MKRGKRISRAAGRIGPISFDSRLIVETMDDCVETGIDGIDARKVRVDHFTTRYVAPCDHFGKLARRLSPQFIGHGADSIGWPSVLWPCESRLCVNRWIVGARPKTLPAAAVPVGLGSVVAVGEGGAWWGAVPLAAVVALALQVGVNYANDYSDGVRGTDDDRVGPVRLVASGLASARLVKRAAFASFGVAAMAGFVLAASTSWWLLAVGAASILAGWFYTGGPRPYGYAGFGEFFVFVFFGLVATVGSTFVVLERLPAATWWLGTSTGALSCALLVTNNLRDVPTDRLVGKKTLAVRLGVDRTRHFYVVLVAMSFVSLILASFVRPEVLFGLIAIPFAVSPIRSVRSGASGPDLIPVLAGTGRVQLAVGALVVAAAIVVG